MNKKIPDPDSDLITNNPIVSGFPSILLGEIPLRTEDAHIMGLNSARIIKIFGAKVDTRSVWNGVKLFTSIHCRA